MNSWISYTRRILALALTGVLVVFAPALLAACSSGDATTTSGPTGDTGEVSTTEPVPEVTVVPSLVTDFDTFTQAFEKLMSDRALEGALPLSVVPEQELAWLSSAAKPLTITEVKGYRLASGDTVVLFFTEPDYYTATLDEQSKIFPAATESIMAAMQDKFRGAHVLMNEPTLGYLIAISSSWEEDYYYQLQFLTGAARHSG